MKREPTELKDLIDLALKRYNFTDTVTRSHVEDAYRKVVSDIILRLTLRLHFDPATGVLYVTLASPALRQELSYKLTDMATAINRRLPSPVVRSVVLK